MRPNQAKLHLAIGAFAGEEWALGQAAEIAGISQTELSAVSIQWWSYAEEIKGTGFKHFNPEAMTVIGSGEAQELLVLSDDGNQQKKAAEPAFRSFRVKP